MLTLLLAPSTRLHVLRGGSTSDNFDQLSGNDSLSGTVVQNLVLANHLTGVLGGVLRDLSVSTNHEQFESE